MLKAAKHAVLLSKQDRQIIRLRRQQKEPHISHSYSFSGSVSTSNDCEQRAANGYLELAKQARGGSVRIWSLAVVSLPFCALESGSDGKLKNMIEHLRQPLLQRSRADQEHAGLLRP